MLRHRKKIISDLFVIVPALNCAHYSIIIFEKTKDLTTNGLASLSEAINLFSTTSKQPVVRCSKNSDSLMFMCRWPKVDATRSSSCPVLAQVQATYVCSSCLLLFRQAQPSPPSCIKCVVGSTHPCELRRRNEGASARYSASDTISELGAVVNSSSVSSNRCMFSLAVRMAQRCVVFVCQHSLCIIALVHVFGPAIKREIR